MRLKENPSLIVFLDDAVDSFDYRNKYAFLEYISRLAPRIAKSGQLFLLSHNFDFYKGVFNCLRSIPKEAHFSPETSVSTFFLKNSNGSISVFDGRPVMSLLNLKSMGRWRHSLNLNEFVTYITIERTFLETRGKSQKALVPYLHYLSDQTTFAGINRAFKIYNDPSFSNGDYYLPMLVNASDNLCSASPFETALADKICLAVAIRILRERFIILSIQKRSLKEETSLIRMQAVAKMEKRLQTALSDSEKMNLLFAKIVSNPNVHANGFSFEPIVDIGFDELIRSYQEIRAMNSTWPIGAEKANVALPS